MQGFGAQRVDEVVDCSVAAHRIMMGERELLHPRKSRYGQGVFDRAVAPADLLRVFAREILCVVHDQIGVGEEFDELVVGWRLRHIQLVERVIGTRMGTGGSAGSSYLKLTLDKKFFPELCQARTLLTE